MPKSHLVALNMNQNEVQNMVLQNLASDPASGKLGQIYVNTTTKYMRLFDGTVWKDIKGNISSIVGVAPIVVTVDANGVATINSTAVTALANGNMLAVDKVKLDAATANNTASTIVMRDASGSFNGNVAQLLKVTGLNNPVNATDATNKQYVDMAVQGLDAKESTRCATTANITVSGLQTIDGISVAAGDRVLVKNQTAGIENGAYIVASGAWTRTTDMPLGSVAAGNHVFVEEGATQAGTGWVCNSIKTASVVATNVLSWVQFSAAGQLVAGAGLVRTGNTIDIVAADGSILVAADAISAKLDPATLMLTAIGINVRDASITAAKLATGITDASMVGGAGVPLGVVRYTPVAGANVVTNIKTTATLGGGVAVPIAHPFGTANITVNVRDASLRTVIVDEISTATNVTLTANGANFTATINISN